MIIFMLAAALGGTTAWAQEQEDEDTTAVTVVESEEVTRGYLERETVGMKPQAGVLVFEDALGNDSSRFALGFTLDWNAANAISRNLENWFIGPSTGFIYSHLGSPGSNFFGADSETPGAGPAGSNFFYVPVNLKAGYTFNNNFRVALHGGGNITYRSVANSLNLGADTSVGTGTDTTIYPNVGADFEFGLGKNSALMIRPDLTITPGDEIFTGTAAVAIAIG